MKVSLPWLENYFEKPLAGKVGNIADALTFHAFEVEEVTGEEDKEVLDINVLADRAGDCLSHRGIAKEISTILSMTLTKDPLRTPLPDYAPTDVLSVTLDSEGKCDRYLAALIQGVKVGPSPSWLKEALESLGQRSINNIVDATNYVMLDIGQPLHAFDAGKLDRKDGAYAISVRGARALEKITTLTNEEYTLPEGTLLITDGHADVALGIAGIKGGAKAAITEATTDIILESAHFDSVSVRKSAQALKLFTDASTRFQNKPAEALAAYGMRDIIALIKDIAGGEVVGVVDVSSATLPQIRLAPVSVSLETINNVLGSALESDQVAGVFDRLGFSFIEQDAVFIVTPPFERNDLVIPEDLIEEVGRIIGYDAVEARLLPLPTLPIDQSLFRGIERIKDFFVARGFTEISTPSFASLGEIVLANPLDQTKPALRASLLENMQDALVRAVPIAPRVLGPASSLALFEIGTIFKKGEEELALSLGYRTLTQAGTADVLKEVLATFEQELLGAHLSARYALDGMTVEIVLDKKMLEALGSVDGASYVPEKATLGMFMPFSVYPFALRDIAVWTPQGTTEHDVRSLIENEAGTLLVRIDLFDQFEKTDKETGVVRTSYASRLVFESPERTLADTDLDPLMEKITLLLNTQGEGWQVR